MPIDDRLFDLLRACQPEQLDILWTSDLRMEPGDNGFEEASFEERVTLLSAEIRSVAGHSAINVLRGNHALSWGDIVRDVVKQLGPDAEEDDEAAQSTRRIEGRILILADRRIRESWDKLSEQEREKVEGSIEASIQFEDEAAAAHVRTAEAKRISRQSITAAITSGLFAGGGAGIIMLSAAASAASAEAAKWTSIYLATQLGGLMLGSSVPMMLLPLQTIAVGRAAREAFKATLVRVLPSSLGSAFGLASLIAIPATVAHIVMSPSYRKLVPAVVHLLAFQELNDASVAH